jgi:hypothetical protein
MIPLPDPTAVNSTKIRQLHLGVSSFAKRMAMSPAKILAQLRCPRRLFLDVYYHKDEVTNGLLAFYP